MSRIGKQPIAIPAGVKVKVADGKITVEGPKAKLPPFEYHPMMKVEVDESAKQIKVSRPGDDRFARSLHGLTRTLVANMIQGVTQGYEKKLKIEGIGYAAKLDKKSVVLTVGFANQIKLDPPEGVTAEVPDPNTIIVRGADKQKVGQFAAEVRHARPPEPYQGKGVRYENEVVRRKEGKSFSTGG
jgi:large subunit ribosomal protein L6